MSITWTTSWILSRNCVGQNIRKKKKKPSALNQHRKTNRNIEKEVIMLFCIVLRSRCFFHESAISEFLCKKNRKDVEGKEAFIVERFCWILSFFLECSLVMILILTSLQTGIRFTYQENQKCFLGKLSSANEASRLTSCKMARFDNFPALCTCRNHNYTRQVDC